MKLVLYRFAVIALLAWCSYELHAIKREMPGTASLESSAQSIAASASQINTTTARLLESVERARVADAEREQAPTIRRFIDPVGR
jgi:hypothetical protein